MEGAQLRHRLISSIGIAATMRWPKLKFRAKSFIVASLAWTFCLLIATAMLGQQPSPPASTTQLPLSAEQVVNNLQQRNRERAVALRQFRSTRIYRMQYRGFPSNRDAEMVVKMEYQSSWCVSSQNSLRHNLVVNRIADVVASSSVRPGQCRVTIAGCSSHKVAALPRLCSKSSNAIPMTSIGRACESSPPCWESSRNPCCFSCACRL